MRAPLTPRLARKSAAPSLPSRLHAYGLLRLGQRLTPGKPLDGQAKTGPKDGMGRDRHEDECRGYCNIEHGRIRGEEHAELEDQGKADAPRPMAPPGIANHRQVHHTERR